MGSPKRCTPRSIFIGLAAWQKTEVQARLNRRNRIPEDHVYLVQGGEVHHVSNVFVTSVPGLALKPYLFVFSPSQRLTGGTLGHLGHLDKCHSMAVFSLALHGKAERIGTGDG